MINLGDLSGEIDRLVGEIQLQTEARAASASLALETLASIGDHWPQLQKRIEQSRTSWLPAEILDSPDAVYPAPPTLSDYTAIAVDGSQIAPDRHGIADFYLIQTGGIILHYGQNSAARRFRDAAIFVGSDEDSLDGRPERKLANHRSNMEFQQLKRAIEMNRNPASPTIGMVDGTLVLWMLEEAERASGVAALLDLLEFGRVNICPIIGYISSPGSREVVTALRLQRCPFEASLCQKFCPNEKGSQKRNAPCGGLEGATDSHLFASRLKAGERSAVFGSRSKVVLDCYSQQDKIKFFYLRTHREIVRIEVPSWVADDPKMLETIHSVCLDQAEKGGGYPVALTEAHECAVVTAEDRRSLNRVLEKRLASLKMPLTVTRKAISKRLPRV
ncbi:MAG: DNA double-strand break repair nuclease NurA [Chthonomonadales bacterium]